MKLRTIASSMLLILSMMLTQAQKTGHNAKAVNVKNVTPFIPQKTGMVGRW
jgi:Skp family chaperone for outer membrane proteins